MQFEKQDYQEQCVKNIINSLKDFDFKNPSVLSLQDSLKNFYKNDGKHLPNKILSNKYNLDVLMETGTGKTFTYINTIFELNKEYGLNKFIIFVPRKAIKLGTIQNIKLTKSYFQSEYEGKAIKLFEYSGGSSISSVSEFIGNTNKEPSVLILTNSSIDKKDNILKKQLENFFSHGKNTLLERLQAINPVIIIDEPHLLKGNQFTKEFDKFQSLCLRFGATFPVEEEHKLSNMVYSLDSISAFQNYLVKKIQVSTITNSSNAVTLTAVDKKHNTLTLRYFINNQELESTLKVNEDIGAKLNISNWQGVSCINIQKDIAYLSSGESLQISTSDYKLDYIDQKFLISATIKNHFEKEEKLFKKGIKTLSLFFISGIKDYDGENPVVKKIFEDEYKKQRSEKLNENISQDYRDYLEKDYHDGTLIVNQGYFATSHGSKEEQELNAIDVILNKKEELLSLQTPLRFIFSVWALQEGWDNPNIFNICKLAPSSKENSKRQQVGRGLRIAVNQSGKRLTLNYLQEDENEFYNINVLDVVVSSMEQNFIKSLQEEVLKGSYKPLDGFFNLTDIKEKGGLNDREASKWVNNLEENNVVEFNELKNDYTVKSSVHEHMIQQKDTVLSFLSEDSFNNVLTMFNPSSNRHMQIENKNLPKQTVNVRKYLYQDFQELWQLINKKSKIFYANIQEENLINSIIQNFSQLTIAPIKIMVKKQLFNAKANIIEEISSVELGNKEFFKKYADFMNFILSISKAEKLPFHFVLKLCNKMIENDQAKENIINNPKLAEKELINIIKHAIHNNILHHVSYKFASDITISNENISILPVQAESLQPIPYTHLGKHIDNTITPKANYLYDKIVYDSNIEKDVINNDPNELNNNKVTVFAKLPKISIPTPFKSYSPDFAYLIQNKEGKKLFLVVETKGYGSTQDISSMEQQKINYAKQFFKDLQKEVTDISIEFKTRINNQNLIDLIKET